MVSVDVKQHVYLTTTRFIELIDVLWLLVVLWQTLVNVLISILLTGMGGLSMAGDPSFHTHSGHRGDNSSPEVAPVFCSAVVKLVAMQMQALGVSGQFWWWW